MSARRLSARSYVRTVYLSQSNQTIEVARRPRSERSACFVLKYGEIAVDRLVNQLAAFVFGAFPGRLPSPSHHAELPWTIRVTASLGNGNYVTIAGSVGHPNHHSFGASVAVQPFGIAER